MRWTVGVKIASGFALAVVILGVIGINSYLSTRKLVETSGWVTHTHEVLEHLQLLLAMLAEAEAGQRGYIITGVENFLEPYNAARNSIAQILKELRNLASDNEQRHLDLLEPLVEKRIGLLEQVLSLRKERPGDEGFKAAQEGVGHGHGHEMMDEIRKVISEMEREERDLLARRSQDAEDSARVTKLSVLIGLPVAILLLAVSSLLITLNISSPLKRMSAAAQRVANGDLTVRLDPNGRADEVGLLGRTISAMVENLRRVTADISEGASTLSVSATQIVASTTQLATGSAQTATAVAQTTTTVEEVRQTAKIAAEKARFVSESAQKALAVSTDGKTSTEQAAEGMSRIREQMASIASSMARLSEQTQAIGQIIATVDDLAQQSNLLAVNAAIEAAKAGEQGKGFAVVAQEVKSLAEQSKAATTQVRNILHDIQKATAVAAMATEQGARAVDAGVHQSSAAGQSIVQLSGSIDEAAAAATQIAASSQQQLVGMDQVAIAMESIKRASSQNVDSARQLEASAKGLSDLGHRLKELVGRYTV